MYMTKLKKLILTSLPKVVTISSDSCRGKFLNSELVNINLHVHVHVYKF